MPAQEQEREHAVVDAVVIDYHLRTSGSVVRNRLRLAARAVRGPQDVSHDNVSRGAGDSDGSAKSLLRASLYTSVLSFGVAASQVAAGVGLVVIGSALRRLGRQRPVVLTWSSAPGPG